MCKKSTDVLPSRKKWLRFLKIFLCVNVIWMGAGLIVLEVQIGFTTLEAVSLCDTSVFILIRSGGQVVNFIFFILGIVITRKVLAFNGSTIYEREELKKANRKALKSLWYVHFSNFC